MAVCSGHSKLRIMAVATLCAAVMVRAGKAADIDDLKQMALDSPMLTNSLFSPSGDDCAKAADTLAAIKSAAATLEGEKKLHSENLAKQKLVHDKDAKKFKTAVNAHNDAVKQIESMQKARGGKKFSSSLEMGPEKAEFLKELESDMRLASGPVKTFAPGSNFAKQDCPANISSAVCAAVESDRRRLFENLYGVFSAQLNMMTTLQKCVFMSLRFFECKPTAESCPMSGIMAGLTFGGNSSTFETIYRGVLAEAQAKGKVTSNGDICQQRREYYEGRLKKYRAKYEGAPQTPAEKVKFEAKAKAEAQIKELEEKLNAADNAVASSESAVAAVQNTLAELEKKYESENKACTGKDCQSEITVARNDWEISAIPEMPSDFTATTNVANAEWTFQASWHYKDVSCDYPAKPEPMRGVFFNPISYAGEKMFGGAYKFTLKAKCKEDVKEVFSAGVITGRNPSKETILNEFRNLGGDGNLEILTKIACHESGIKQFLKGGEDDCPGKPGMPYACKPHDFGIFQISEKADNHANHCKAAWDWKFNVVMGVNKWKISFRNAENQHISEAMTVDEHRFNEALQKCIIGKTHDALLAMITTNNLPLNKLPIFDKMLKAAITGGGFSDFKKSMMRAGVNEDKLLEFIKEFTASYYPDKMDEQQISDDAIRRFNGGRENRWDPIDSTIGFSSGNCRDGKWIAHTKETKNPEYITDVRKADGCIKKQK